MTDIDAGSPSRAQRASDRARTSHDLPETRPTAFSKDPPPTSESDSACNMFSQMSSSLVSISYRKQTYTDGTRPEQVCCLQIYIFRWRTAARRITSKCLCSSKVCGAIYSRRCGTTPETNCPIVEQNLSSRVALEDRKLCSPSPFFAHLPCTLSLMTCFFEELHHVSAITVIVSTSTFGTWALPKIITAASYM